MTLSANGKALLTATRDLAVKWEQTRETWRDEKSREFEEKYLQELFNSVERTVLVFEQIDKAIINVRKECE
jgi:hypothetical protein